MIAIETPESVPCEMVLQVVDVVIPISKPNPDDYDVEFDEQVLLAGDATWVKVLYPNNIGEIDVFTLDENCDGDRLVSGEISRGEYEYLLRLAEAKADEKAEELREAALRDAEERKGEEQREYRQRWTGVAVDVFENPEWWVKP